MSDLRIFTIEIETQDDEAEYDLHSALSGLAETVAAEGGNYRMTVSESGDEIFSSQSIDWDNDTPDAD